MPLTEGWGVSFRDGRAFVLPGRVVFVGNNSYLLTADGVMDKFFDNQSDAMAYARDLGGLHNVVDDDNQTGGT